MGHRISVIHETDGHALLNLEAIGSFNDADGAAAFREILDYCHANTSLHSVSIVSGPWNKLTASMMTQTVKGMGDLFAEPLFKNGVGIFAHNVFGIATFFGKIAAQAKKMEHLVHMGYAGYKEALEAAEKDLIEKKQITIKS